MLTIAFNLLSKKSSVKEGIPFVSDFVIKIESFSEVHITQSYTVDFSISLEILSVFVYSKTENFLRAYKYYQLVELTQEDLIKKDKFLTDYHTVKFIANDGGIDRINVALSLVGLSNLLRLASEFCVDEIHAVSLRIFRKRSEVLNKDVFIITEY